MVRPSAVTPAISVGKVAASATTKCAAGKITKTAASATNDAICNDCPIGKVKATTSADPSNVDACATLNVCTKGTFTKVADNTTSDAVCETRASGKFKGGDSADATKVDTCLVCAKGTLSTARAVKCATAHSILEAAIKAGTKTRCDTKPCNDKDSGATWHPREPGLPLHLQRGRRG